MLLALDTLVSGAVMGTLYGLMALGLSLVFGIFNVVNFAHGEFYMVGGYAYFLLVSALGWPPLVAIAGAALVGALLGVATERLLIRPMYSSFTEWGRSRDEYSIIVTFGLSLLLLHLATVLMGPQAVKAPAIWRGPRVFVGPLVLGRDRVVAFLVGAVILLVIYLVVNRTLLGKQLQAVAQNRLGAALAGIDPVRWGIVGFGAAGAMAATAGALLAPLYLVFPESGTLAAAKSFVIVVLGGLGSLPGSIVGGLLLGVVESFGAVYVAPSYRDGFGFALLLATLLARPSGLFGARVRRV